MQKYSLTIILFFSISLIIIAGYLIINLSPIDKKKAGVSSSIVYNQAPSLGGEFSLINVDTAKEISTALFRGKLLLVYFGYSYCPDICPMELGKISVVMDELGGMKDKVQPLFITVDPARDTIDHMKNYIKSFSPELIGLTGTKEQIDKATSLYKVYYAKDANSNKNNYLINHSSFIYLMDKEGKYLAHFDIKVDSATMLKVIRKHLQ